MHLPLFTIWSSIHSLGWHGAFELLRGGVVLGALYALVALGYSLVYGILKLLNFAHGDVFMVGAFMGYGVLSVLSGHLGTVPLIIVMFVVAMLGTGGLGVAIERFAYRPLRNAPRIAPLISALGVAFFLESSVQLLTNSAHYQYSNYPVFFSLIEPAFSFHIEGVLEPVSIVSLIVVGSSIALMFALLFLVNRTRLGKAMRATAFDREAAAMMGINTDRVISAAFFIGSALAGAAGVMYGLQYSDISYLVGFAFGLKAFTAAVVGGIGSIEGAMLGGLLVGLVEVFAGGYAGGQWVDVAVFGLLIAFLLVRPTGILGKHAIQKV
ncbi:MAG TPA: branched-chain amino acid ABC transporter permease [Gaiellaceae bacterium]